MTRRSTWLLWVALLPAAGVSAQETSAASSLDVQQVNRRVEALELQSQHEQLVALITQAQQKERAEAYLEQRNCPYRKASTATVQPPSTPSEI